MNSMQGEGEKHQNKCSMLKMLTSEVTINLNVLGTFMKYWVVSNLNDTFVMTLHESLFRKRDAYPKVTNTTKVFQLWWMSEHDTQFL